jgi:hypothetical protein
VAALQAFQSDVAQMPELGLNMNELAVVVQFTSSPEATEQYALPVPL